MIKIICVGKLKEKYLVDLCDDYFNRIKKYHKINIINIKDNDDISKEEKAILPLLNGKECTIYLDIKGKKLSSKGFAKLINETFINYGCITFLIGGSNGVTDVIKDKCNYLLSFSDFTLPHGLFRGVLLEQIYRAFKINNNEGYHK